MAEKLTYAGVGINYAVMDPFKRQAQQAARVTSGNITRLGFTEVEWSRGESAHLIDLPDAYLASIVEGLGTKNLVADAMYRSTGKSYYDHVAQDTVAMIVNDLITLGALPVSVEMHVAAGDSDWFQDQPRCRDLIAGWQKACNLARCSWGGGETPTLKGVVLPGTVVLSGAAVGIIKPKERLIKGDIQSGDAIVLVESSGIHANGLTLARTIAEREEGIWRRLAHFFFPRRFPLRALRNGYLTELSNDRTYGEMLLDPTLIYVPLVEDCLNDGVPIHYAVHITGHGWRKLMRATQPFAYVIDRVPQPQPIFTFIQKHGPVDDREMYGTFNMGAGFALYLPLLHVERVCGIAAGLGFTAFHAGNIESSPTRKVVIKPKGLEYGLSDLEVR